jgi:hypothetical protein
VVSLVDESPLTASGINDDDWRGLDRRRRYPLGEHPSALTDELAPYGPVMRIEPRPVTVEDIQGWVDAAPETAREILDRGPRDGLRCGLCVMLRAHDEEHAGEPWLEDLWTWHGYQAISSIPDVERYLRCVLVYICGGWDGVIS